MGGDGGVIASQRKFVRGTKSSDETEKDSKNIKQQQITRSRICAQSSEVFNQNSFTKILLFSRYFYYNLLTEITGTNCLL
jgi:hypothetical protein